MLSNGLKLYIIIIFKHLLQISPKLQKIKDNEMTSYKISKLSFVFWPKALLMILGAAPYSIAQS